MKKGKWSRILAWILCVGILTQSIPVYAENSIGQQEEAVINETVPEESKMTDSVAEFAETESIQESRETDTEQTAEYESEEDDLPETGNVLESENAEESAGEEAETDSEKNSIEEGTDLSAVYEEGKIKISNIRQLQAIGSGAALTDQDNIEETFGKGIPVEIDGKIVTYGMDSQYLLTADILLDGQAIWQLPAGFAGAFSGEPADETAPLYDKETDTIYIYNNYQLMTIASENSEQEPVMSKDMIPSEFGMGQLIYKDGTPSDESAEAAQEYLTYSKDHNYVLSKNFTEQMPELAVKELSDEIVWLDGEQANGRAVPGQLYIEIDGEKYILIGNESQLRAVGSNKHVTPRLYIYTSGSLAGPPSYVPYYPGDADLGLEAVASEGGTKHGILGKPDEVKGNSYTYYEEAKSKYKLADVDLTDDSLLESILGLLESILGGILGSLLGGDSEFCGVDATGRPNYEEASLSKLKEEYGDLYYSSDANYIIFRDINLDADGENSNGETDEWTPIHLSGNMEGRKGMTDGAPVTISNITVEQSADPIDPSTTRGFGFFGSISSKSDETKLGSSAGTTVVEDIHLDKVSVTNQSTTVAEVNDTLVESLLNTVGGLLSSILGGVEDLLGNLLGWLIPGLDNLKLSTVVEGLLKVQQSSPDIFAAGSFAGRVIGDVRIENCTVTQATVSSASGITGGFVGYTEGEAQYDLLSHLGDKTVKLLSGLLNLIPGLGLGDLITVLLENNIDLGNLIPIGYYNPQINNCSVTLSNGVLGKESTDYNGGFVGIQNATKMTSCTVSGLVSVSAGNGAGGFAGMERDAVVNSLLSSVGVDLVTFDIQSGQTNCRVNGSTITITAKNQYAGGFNGVMTNSISSSCIVSNIANVRAAEYAGGFAGRATIGYGTTIGGEDEKRNTLLSSVTKLLEELLAPGNENKLNTLLSLSGLTPSKLNDCTVSGTGWSVSASGDYAGGMIGQGDGVKIASGGEAGSQITGLSSVTALNYAGGIAGSAVTANPIGVLNNTIGVGSYLPFTVSQVTLTGQTLKVEASQKYASGGFGLALGGNVDNVSVNGLASVTAGNYAGGMAGRSGTGALVKEGGLDLLGLGAVKVDNLLSLADGVQVTINNAHVTGVEEGAVIQATGAVDITDGESVMTGGFVSEAEGIQVSESGVSNLKQVLAEKKEGKDSYAGGFAGRSHTGGLAGLAQETEDGVLKLPNILEVSSLLDLVPYLIPKYTDCTVYFISNGENPQIKAQYAGGFFGAMQSGKVDNSAEGEPYAVYGLEYVKGTDYAGGFAGKADAGAAAASDGLKLLDGVLTLDITDLLSVLNVYIPQITSAGVKSADGGYIVEADAADSSAGGYIGYGSGVRIKDSDVMSLKHTNVTPPSDSLESKDGTSYFNKSSSYAVRAGRYAGGYIGCADIDSAAGVGEGLGLLGGAVELGNLTQALDTVATKIENSDVNGCVGGYSVLAGGSDDKNNKNNNLGKAGGFIGEMSGTIIKNSDANLFAYVIGREAAGGYAGIMEPGNVASVLEDASILDGLLNVTDSLANLVQSFIPIIEDSQTSSVPCGGAVRAEGFTDTQCVRGLAGGYVGYNHGGRILGNAAAEGGKECAAVRIRSVYGGEFAGGFTGLMETADLAGTGNLELLFGLLWTSNVLSLLGAVYPTETNTAVYGPLRKVDVDTWNKWAEAVGSDGVYGDQFPNKPVDTEEQLQELIKKYAYGYNVKAGRTTVGTQDMEAGVAGGYVGRMKAGVVTNAHAWDAKNVIAYTSAGGFAGEMKTGGVAEVGKVSLLNLDITGSISAVQTFVPVVRNSDVTGFQSGMTVKATGTPVKDSTLKIEKVGYAGGYVGHMLGGQIWGNWSEINTYSATDAAPDPNNKRCFVANLRKVEGTKAIGGFAGQIDPASAAALDTASSGGLLGGLLQSLIKTPGELAQLLDATLSTVHAADIFAWDDWGIIINGAYTADSQNTAYAKAAGGFAGEVNGAVIGEKDVPDNGVHVSNIRSVTGGEYAGGFIGLADVSAVLQVSEEGNTSILAALLTLGGTSVLDAFRTYIYSSDVSGAAEAGLEVQARDSKKTEYVNDPVYSGSAGGFGGALLNGSVKDSKVTKLRRVNGMNYTGGFIGHLGKSGTVDLDNLGALGDLLSAGAGVMDVFGSHVDRCSVEGVTEGFTVHSDNTIDAKEKSEIAGGFTGLADLGRLSDNTVTGLKQVTSGQIAGGFAGKTTSAYLAEIKLDSELVKILVQAVNQILNALQLDDLQKGDVIKIDLGIIKVDALYDGELVSLNLLGLDIKVGLAKEQSLATIQIGDSEIKINCSEGGTIDEESLKNEINISLIKANRTKIDSCTVTGIADGYDVYGGGAGNNANGTGEYGIAGGFVGWNNEGLLEKNNMFFADVVRGAKDLTGPFTGKSSLKSNWEFNDVEGIEGNENYYRIYRDGDTAYEQLLGKSGKELQNKYDTSDAWKNIYTIRHMTKDKVVKFTDLKDANMSGIAGKTSVDVYQEDGAMAVLMNNTASSPTEPGGGEETPDVQDPCKDLIELRVKKVWKGDEEKDRPSSEVVFHITRSYEVNGQTITDDTFNEKVILKKEDAQTSDIWEKVLSGAQFTAYHVGADGEKYYYTYQISETKVDGYETTITYKGDYQYNITVTNKKNWFDSLLPDTGGMGTAWIYMIGVLLLCSVAAWEYRKRKVQRRQDNYK